MKVLYIGNNESGQYVFSKECKKRGLIYEKLNTPEKIELGEYRDMILKAAPNYCVFDLSSIYDEESDLVEHVMKIHQAINTKVIIFAPGFSEDSKIVTSLKAIGIGAFVFEADNLGKITSAFLACLNGTVNLDEETQESLIVNRENTFADVLRDNPQLAWDSKVPPESVSAAKPPVTVNEANASMPQGETASQLNEVPIEVPPAKKHVESNIPKSQPLSHRGEEPTPIRPLKKAITPLKIAVIGSMNRIGSTTTALQLVKYLNQQEEQSAAYVEYNRSGYIHDIRNAFFVEKENTDLEMVRVQSVDLYYNPKKVPEILSQGYSYLVYDYGDIGDLPDHSSIYERDLIFLVGGVKANEIRKMTDAMRKVQDQNYTFYLFNFVPPGDESEILNLQAERQSRTFFLQNAVDPFLYNPDNGGMFKNILSRDFEKVDVTQGKRKKLGRMFL